MLAEAVSRAPDTSSREDRLKYQGEVCLKLMEAVEVLTNRLVEIAGNDSKTLREDCLILRSDAVRMWRRYQFGHPKSQQEFEEVVWWMTEHANEDDLALLRWTQSETAAGRSAQQRALLSMAETVIVRRLATGKSALAFLEGLNIKVTYAAIAVMGAILSLAMVGPSRFLPILGALVALGLAGGTGVAVALFREAVVGSRSEVSRVCFFAAGIIMLAETAGLLRSALLIR